MPLTCSTDRTVPGVNKRRHFDSQVQDTEVRVDSYERRRERGETGERKEKGEEEERTGKQRGERGGRTR